MLLVNQAQETPFAAQSLWQMINLLWLNIKKPARILKIVQIFLKDDGIFIRKY